MRVLSRALIPLLTLVSLTVPAFGQGTGTQTLNFEPPVHKPIQVVRVGTRDFLLVANVSDDAVEVYDTAGPNFLFRVPTGQAPVTIAVRPTPTATGGRQVYTANWLGDSVTVFEIDPAGTGLTFRLVTTEPVGDEPIGLAFLPANPAEPATMPGGPFHELLLVTFSTKSQWGVFLPGSVQAVLPGIELLDPTGGFGVKDPRAIAFSPVVAGVPNRLWMLNFRGGNDPTVYDFDLWGSNNTTASAGNGRATQPRLGGLGTSNYQMTFQANGDLWVVGQRARNKDPQLGPSLILAVGEPIHQNQVLAETGFVTSYLARVRNLNAAPVIDFLDLNDTSQGAAIPPQQDRVPVTQPTDVVAYPNGSRVFVVGFNSDTLASVRPTATGAPSTWSIRRVDLAPPNALSVNNPGGAMRGPRGLALMARGAAPFAGDRLFIYNRVENSVTVVDPVPVTPVVLSTFPLRGQVEPAYVITGRKFLYSSRLSGTGVPGVGGNVSCASCHLDGNTDFLAWNLSDGGAIPAPGTPNALPGALGPNPGIKGQLVTQPLRGLVNFEVMDAATQDLFFSNRPYHWRGDKGFLEQFNAAFVNLMGAPNRSLTAPTPAFNEGLPLPEMAQYRNFVFSMHYPPNPDQPFDRVYSGTLGNVNDAVSGSGAQLGFKAFHITPSDGFGVNPLFFDEDGNPLPIVLACEHCHNQPEGSNNRFTEGIANFDEPAFPAQGLETAQLKALVLKEKRLQRVVSGAFQPVPASGAAITGEFGLTHTGLQDGIPGFGSLTINDFVNGFGLNAVNPVLQDAMSLYMREFDSGVGPLVGFTATTDVPRFNVNPAGSAAALTTLEDQVRRANAGLAVHAVIAGVLRGFWFDVSDGATPYHEEPQLGIPPLNLSQTQLLDLVRNGSGTVSPGNLLTFHFTPLGSQRRVARVQGGLAPSLAGGAPTAVALAPAIPNTANRNLPLLTVNWVDQIANFNLVLASSLPFVDLRPQAATVHFQQSLLTWVQPPAWTGPPGFGLLTSRHEAPRRLQVTGTGIQEGAFLFLFPPNAADIAAATTTTPPPGIPNAGSNPFVLVLPIYPSVDPTNPAAPVIWQSAVELDAVTMMAFLNGGPGNIPVVNTFLDPLNPALFVLTPPFNYQVNVTNLFNPLQANWYFVQVANQTSTGLQVSAGSWQRLTIQ